MNKVTTINLNGIAYQVEESGYEAISAYLKQAGAKLEGNPDKDEIMRDFEQAVADKFQTYLNANKNVVTTDEVQKVIDAMGPVEGEGATADPEEAKSSTEANTPRRLYHVHEGSFLMGVCTGLALYFNVDVALVRIVFIILAIVTSGGALLAYFLIALFTPQACTIADAQAGQGRPFNANEFIQQAQQDYTQFRDKRARREWKRAMKYGVPPQGANYPVGGFYLFPFFNLLRIVIFLVFLGAVVSLLRDHTIFGYFVPFHLPFWIALIALFAVWRFVTFPIQWIKYRSYASYSPTTAKYFSGSNAFWHMLASILWVSFLIFCGWLAYMHVPYVHQLFTNIAAHFGAIQ